MTGADASPGPAAAGPGLPHHEQVVVARDEASGLRAVVAIHSTALGPSLGGTRLHPYADDDAAATDALRLSRAMTYKNALAGLAHGGGKAVVIGDAGALRGTDRRALMLAYGRLVASLSGRYVTACDVGTTVADMDTVAEVCPWTTGRSPSQGGSGDSGVLTAVGVFAGMRACAEHLWGTPTLRGRRVGVLGAGKVGRRLARHLADDGARVVVADVSPAAVAALRAEVPEAEVVDPSELVEAPLDVLSPNALGGLLTMSSAASLQAELVCGGANNQLAEPEVADLLAGRGVLYAPDFLVNCGGVVQVADERSPASAEGPAGFWMPRARARVEGVFTTMAEVLELAAARGVTPVAAAEAVAERRVEQALADPDRVPFPRFG